MLMGMNLCSDIKKTSCNWKRETLIQYTYVIRVNCKDKV
jgi:hypothetical protein